MWGGGGGGRGRAPRAARGGSRGGAVTELIIGATQQGCFDPAGLRTRWMRKRKYSPRSCLDDPVRKDRSDKNREGARGDHGGHGTGRRRDVITRVRGAAMVVTRLVGSGPPESARSGLSGKRPIALQISSESFAHTGLAPFP